MFLSEESGKDEAPIYSILMIDNGDMTNRRRTAWLSDGPPGPVVPFQRPKEAIACPIKASMGFLGRKWALVVLRDLAFLSNPTFGSILARNPGLTPRVLSFRLREMRTEGLVEKVADATDERVFHYRLTAKGRAAVPILTALIAFGMEQLPQKVWADGRARTLEEVFPGRAQALLGPLYDYARTGGGASGSARHLPPRPAAPSIAGR
jgi:DNA-binding HxlR family transcriptional regulator